MVRFFHWRNRPLFLPLLAELKRRRVIRAVLGHGVAAFAVLQIIEPVMHGLHWPDAVLSYVVVALAIFRLASAALARHDLGHAKESQQAIDELIAKYARVAAYQIAGVYAWRGENDRAFEWLARARAQRDGGLTILKVDPILRGLRTDPRWRPMLESVNLPAD